MTKEEREVEYKRIEIELEKLTEEQKKKLYSKENFITIELEDVSIIVYFDGTREVIQKELD